MTASSPEREANAANNYVGGAYQLAAPSIVRVDEGATTYQVTFKNVPYATQYDIYYGNYDSKGKPVNLRIAATVKAEKSGAGSQADANTGWVKGNQTASVRDYRHGLLLLEGHGAWRCQDTTVMERPCF